MTRGYISIRTMPQISEMDSLITRCNLFTNLLFFFLKFEVKRAENFIEIRSAKVTLSVMYVTGSDNRVMSKNVTVTVLLW
jgi:hypothetical protein